MEETAFSINVLGASGHPLATKRPSAQDSHIIQHLVTHVLKCYIVLHFEKQNKTKPWGLEPSKE